MLAQKPALQAEIKELQELVDLYVRSNPNWNKSAQPEPTPEPVKEQPKEEVEPVDLLAEFKAAFKLEVMVRELKADKEHSGAQAESLAYIHAQDANDFADCCAKLAAKSEFPICKNGLPYAEMHDWVRAEHKRQQETVPDLDEDEAAAIGDAMLDCVAVFDDFDETPAAAEPKAAEPKKEAPKEEKVAAVEEETKEPVKTEGTPTIQERRDGNARRGRGEYRGRGERRGRGEYRGNRDNYRKNPREDEDGFIVETGEKPKPRRDNRGRGGYRGERGEYRGSRGDRRGGNRPRTEGTTQPAEQQQQSQQ